MMEFSFENYQKMLSNRSFYPPCAFVPYIHVNRVQYRHIEVEHKNKNNTYRNAFHELSKRVSREHYWKVYPVQSRTLNYAQMAFPSYKFILPEVIADDWLAIVDWHKFQRDHALHQPLTAYIVMKLLGFGISQNAFQINGISLLDLCIDNLCDWKGTKYIKEYLLETHVLDRLDHKLWFDNKCSKELWKAIFIETAYLAAVFHDMGYPWQYINTLSNKLEYSGYHQANKPTEDTENIIRDFGQRLMFCPLNGYRLLDRNAPSTWNNQLKHIVSKSLRKTHGFPGAIGFLYFNDVLREFPNSQLHPIKQFCVEWASMAIMMHDMGGIYWGHKKLETPPEHPQLRLRFNIDPLGCIIALADVLEDFERPIVDFSSHEQNSKGQYKIACKSSSIECSNGELKISYQMNSKKDKVNKIPFMENECKEYFDQRYGYLDLSSCGIDKVTMEAVC